MENREPKFIYIRNENGFPVGCLAYVANYEAGIFAFSVSTHNPKDKFNRKLAREVAGGRLTKGNWRSFAISEKDGLKELLVRAMKIISWPPSNYPGRLQKAAKQYLARDGVKGTTKIRRLQPTE